MNVIKQQVENMSQQWMNNVSKALNDELKCDASQISIWDTATIRTNFDNEKELDLQIQYNDTKDQYIYVAVMMQYMPEDDYVELEQNFHYCMKIDMIKTSPEHFTNYVIKLYEYNTKLMKKHLNSVID